MRDDFALAAQQAAPEATVIAAPAPPGAPVCLVCHNALRAEDAANQLRKAGHEVEILSSIVELTERVVTCQPSAVVVDFEHDDIMIESLRRLVAAREASYARFPIVWISSRHHFEACLLAARMGIDFYLTHPVDFTGLSDRLRHLMQARGGSPHRVLAITNDRTRSEPYMKLLRSAYMEVRRLDRLRDLLQVMDDYRPEVVLTDIDLPNCSNADVARLIRQRLIHFDVPILFIARGPVTAAGAGLVQSGADDLICAPFDPGHFVTTIQHRAERFRSLRSLIMRDSLTGLFNHAAIKESIGYELGRCARAKVPLSLAMIDIDFFKKVNDSYGHPVGDQVIRALSHLLRNWLRSGDIVGRYGGEEFAVVLPGTGAAAAAAVLDEIRIAFAELRHAADTREFTASFSAGIVDTGKSTDAEELLAAADAALYEAKRGGRNRIEIG